MGKDFEWVGWYAGQVSNSLTWRRHADELLAAAELIEPSVRAHWDWVRALSKGERRPFPGPSLQQIHFLLCAYAIENLLKARIVGRHVWDVRDEAQETARLPKYLQGHNLNSLAKAAGVALTVDEEILLRRLTRHARWMGRYPAPLRADEMRSTPLSDGRQEGGQYFWGSDLERVGDLVQRLRGIGAPPREESGPSE